MILKTATGSLYYEIIDITPPWLEHPETIVFCHGVAVNSDIWAAWLPVLAPHFRIVRFDMRGFGRSVISEDGPTWSLDGLADDILSVALAARAERFHLVGESIGGTICLYFASRADSRLLTVSCVSTAYRGAKIQKLQAWREFILNDGMEAWSVQMMNSRFYPEALTRSQWQWFHNLQRQTQATTVLDIGDLLLRTDLSKRLPKILIPTLLLTPDASPFVSIDMANSAHKLIKNSEMAVFPRSRHGLPFSHARLCAEAVFAFLKAHDH